MLSHTVYRGRDNAIILNLVANEEPAGALDDVEITIDGEFIADTESEVEGVFEYAASTLTMKLGLVAGIAILDDGVYMIEVVGFSSGSDDGTAYGTFLIYLTDFGGEANGS